MLKFNPDKRMSAEAGLGDAFVEKFHLQEPEPSCDKILRMPIPDNTKLKAADYRNQIYSLIKLRQKQAKEEEGLHDSDSPRTSSPRKGSKAASRKASKESLSSGGGGARISERHSAGSVAGNAPSRPWMHTGGEEAPPTTPCG